MLNTLALSWSHQDQGILTAPILLTPFHHPSLLTSSLDGIKSLHKTGNCKFLRVGQHWSVHVWESIGKRYL